MEGKERQAESTHLLQEFRARIQDYHERKGLKPWEQVYAAAGIVVSYAVKGGLTPT